MCYIIFLLPIELAFTVMPSFFQRSCLKLTKQILKRPLYTTKPRVNEWDGSGTVSSRTWVVLCEGLLQALGFFTKAPAILSLEDRLKFKFLGPPGWPKPSNLGFNWLVLFLMLWCDYDYRYLFCWLGHRKMSFSYPTSHQQSREVIYFLFFFK